MDGEWVERHLAMLLLFKVSQTSTKVAWAAILLLHRHSLLTLRASVLAELRVILTLVDKVGIAVRCLSIIHVGW